LGGSSRFIELNQDALIEGNDMARFVE